MLIAHAAVWPPWSRSGCPCSSSQYTQPDGAKASSVSRLPEMYTFVGSTSNTTALHVTTSLFRPCKAVSLRTLRPLLATQDTDPFTSESQWTTMSVVCGPAVGRTIVIRCVAVELV